MKYLAIVETAAESTESVHKGRPAEFPARCEEFESLEAAQAAHPGRKVFSEEAYRAYAEAMNLFSDHVRAEKPWWKFW